MSAFNDTPKEGGTPSDSDHRPAVARRRRGEMRQRLIEAGIVVLACQGIENTVIDDIITAANVSRGTFYRYFRTVEELRDAAKLELGDELRGFLLATIPDTLDPAVRLIQTLNCFLDASDRVLVLQTFIARHGTKLFRNHGVGHGVALQIYQGGVARGRFVAMPEALFLDLFHSAIATAVIRMAEGQSVDSAEVTAAMLRIVGLPVDEAEALSRQPLLALDLPDDCLICRVEAAYRQIPPERRPAADTGCGTD